jgi:hypothetical protein
VNCDRCENEATIHITEIRRGLPSDRHLCEKCADLLLPLEESDYADYLDILPPRHSTQVSDESPPTKEELEMTGIHQRVVVVDLSTGEHHPVGPQKGDSFSPVWSPDSKRLATCHSIETLQSLVLVEPGRTWMRRFLYTTFTEPASWSPDGRRICFSHPEEGGRIVLVGEAEEGRILRLTPGTSWLDEFLPVWSPWDDRIAFVSRRAEGPGDEAAECTVCTTTLDAGKRLRLITLGSSLVMRLAWSSDARFLAALAVPPGEGEMEDILGVPGGSLFVTRSDSEDTSPGVVPGNYLSFAWVSEGKRGQEPFVRSTLPGLQAKGSCPRFPSMVLAAARAGHEATTTAVLIHPETGELSTVAEDVSFPAGEVESSHLSTDGRTLVALRQTRGGRIVLVDVETREVREIEPRGEVAWLGWRPGREEIAALIRHDRGVCLEMISPQGARREITTFKREDFFDVPGLALSPDGNSAAVELHAPRKD